MCTLSTSAYNVDVISYKYTVYNIFICINSIFEFSFWHNNDSVRFVDEYCNKRYTGHCGFFFFAFYTCFWVCICVWCSGYGQLLTFFLDWLAHRLPERIVATPNKTAIFNVTKHRKIVWSFFVHKILWCLKLLRLHTHYHLVWHECRY